MRSLPSVSKIVDKMVIIIIGEPVQKSDEVKLSIHLSTSISGKVQQVSTCK